jgi:hypothetical protein
LIVTGSSAVANHRNLIIALTLGYRLPNVYGFRYYPASGGLASYGPDAIDAHRRAAGYVDRILKGEKPVDLPVQTPTKYELVINLKTAKAARYYRSAGGARPRRRGHRVRDFVALDESASGTARHLGKLRNLVAIGA